MVQRMITRRRALQLGALGGSCAAATPLKFALADNEPFKIGSGLVADGARAPVGKMGLVGVQMAVDRINKAGGIKGRPVKLFAEDDEIEAGCRPPQGRELLTEDKIDAHVGGVLSNICLACMPVYEDHQIVNMITVCLDTTITTSEVQAAIRSAPTTTRRPRRSPRRPISSPSSARSGTSSTPTIPGASRPATPMSPRSRSRAATLSARPGSRSARPT